MPTARCPMCHQANDEKAWQCRRCGYEFGKDVDTLRGLLQAQLRRSRTAFWIFATIDAGVIAGVAYLITQGLMILPSAAALVTMTWWTVRMRQKIGITRHSLKLIEPARPQLPRAVARSVD